MVRKRKDPGGELETPLEPLLEEEEQRQALEGIRRGLEDVARGRTLLAREALERIRKVRRIPRDRLI